MTSFIYSGHSLNIGEDGRTAVSTTPMEFRVVALDGERSFNYSIIRQSPDSLAEVDIDAGDVIASIDGRRLEDFGPDVEDNIGVVRWGNGKSTTLLIFYDESAGIDHVIQMAGDRIDFSTLSSLQNFLDSIDTAGPVTSGPFQPGRNIAFDSFGSPEVTEDDDVLGSTAGETLNSGRGDDTVNGDDGNDRINTGSGEDVLIGGAGRDRLNGGSDDDEVHYSAEEEFYGTTRGVVVNLAQEFARDSFGDRDTLTNIEVVRGTSFADRIQGADNREFQQFQALGGDDTLNVSDLSFDTADYRKDVQYGGRGAIDANLETGKIVDGFGDTDTVSSIERVRGTEKGDTMLAGAEGVRFDGYGGNDKLFGSMANDRIYGGTGNDRIEGRDGADVVSGESGNDLVIGGRGRDQVLGGDGNDTLRGGDAADRVLGGDGRDVISGGRGDDRLNGGADEDTFVFSGKVRNDRIEDFEDNVDTIRLDEDLWGGGLSVRKAIKSLGEVTDDGYLLTFNSVDSLLIEDVTARKILFNDIELI
ncbi:MAG: calcium-binding protein [Pseudomonadota bacterium]